MGDPSNKDSSVCAMCKHNTVRRIQKTKLECEKTGCLSFDLHNSQVRVEEVMNRMDTLFKDHKQHAIEYKAES